MFNSLAQIQKRSKYFLAVAVGLVVIIVGILVYSIISTRPEPLPPTPQPSIKPEVLIPDKSKVAELPQDTKALRQKIIESKIEEHGGDQILFKNDSYGIIYVPTPDLFIVQIASDPQQARQEAQLWFLKFGLKQEDLCSLPVRFALGSIELKKANPNFNYLPDNCPTK